MKKCETCKFWSKEEHYAVDKDKGICTNPKITGYGHEKYENEDDMLFYQYDEGGVMYCGKDFGCVHHKEEL